MHKSLFGLIFLSVFSLNAGEQSNAKKSPTDIALIKFTREDYQRVQDFYSVDMPNSKAGKRSLAKCLSRHKDYGINTDNSDSSSDNGSDNSDEESFKSITQKLIEKCRKQEIELAQKQREIAALKIQLGRQSSCSSSSSSSKHAGLSASSSVPSSPANSIFPYNSQGNFSSFSPSPSGVASSVSSPSTPASVFSLGDDCGDSSTDVASSESSSPQKKAQRYYGISKHHKTVYYSSPCSDRLEDVSEDVSSVSRLSLDHYNNYGNCP